MPLICLELGLWLASHFPLNLCNYHAGKAMSVFFKK